MQGYVLLDITVELMEARSPVTHACKSVSWWRTQHQLAKCSKKSSRSGNPHFSVEPMYLFSDAFCDQLISIANMAWCDCC